MRKVLLAILTVFIFIGCGEEKQEAQATPIKIQKENQYKIGDKIKLKGVNGKEITLVRTEEGFKLDGEKKILMIDIFGTFCEPCREEAAHLTSFQVNNIDDFFMVGLNHFEDVTDEEIKENFMKKYNGYYFIANNQDNPNEKIIEQILVDLDYKRALTVPFKVVYNTDGVIERLTDNEMKVPEGKEYYIGQVGTRILNADIGRIRDAKTK
ncbi:protein disulfide reductase, TlpA family [Campylobacter blaseri]|uniref:Thioredoxin n=1 Tax=Campylobacter blaseri TaxID=2042961 RepID=A0A2P8R1W4_9BACT|nr:hypothetical protein [Campylobacter blaseri]PSM52495.1 hypothetical protein CQ405_01855 [Campylobacter blaseri]PSM54143.1 hypothetical protein CRN67_01855 [Campylobacter blaseri]QKF85791.1 protein disulfide reductase, TlpA family [Campylobacter blaseri]